MNVSNTRRDGIPNNTATTAKATMARGLIALACTLPLLTACYVVPVHPDGRVYPPPGTQAAQAGMAMAATMTFAARLYPANETAARTGIIAGSVTSPQSGKGIFTLPYNGETLSGESTRTSSGNLHTGVANAASPRGQFVRCTYRMTSQNQGSGECEFSDGARFQMHVSG
jgi:hypothetical protein